VGRVVFEGESASYEEKRLEPVGATHGKKIGTKNEDSTDEISIFRENSGSDDVGVRDADWL
jgi:hypothetical protein